MNIPVLNRRQSREVDRRAIEEFGMTGLVLMENAGRGVADRLCELGVGSRVVICCGKGNNAGDGFVIARHLELRGVAVTVLLLADPGELRGDALANYLILEKSGTPRKVVDQDWDAARFEAELGGADWIVDAMLGTGATGEPRPPLDLAIQSINRQAAPVLAVDLPSGLDCDTGEAAGNTIRAAHTCTFVAQKPGFLQPGAAAYTGQVHVLDIGAPRALIQSLSGS